MTAIMLRADCMDLTLDARGLACPCPPSRPAARSRGVPPGGALTVLATDPEAPIDLAALATDEDCAFAAEREPATAGG